MASQESEATTASQKDVVCEICDKTVSDERCVGCCNDDDCPKKVENMCSDCGMWDKMEEVWRCPPCAAAHDVTDPVFGQCFMCEGGLRQSFDVANRWCGDFCRPCGKEHDNESCEVCDEKNGSGNTPTVDVGGAGTAPAAGGGSNGN